MFPVVLGKAYGGFLLTHKDWKLRPGQGKSEFLFGIRNLLSI